MFPVVPCYMFPVVPFPPLQQKMPMPKIESNGSSHGIMADMSKAGGTQLTGLVFA